MVNKLPPLAQKYYDENRERFDAETTSIVPETKTCPHDFYRKSATEIGCQRCSNGWIDPDGSLWAAIGNRC